MKKIHFSGFVDLKFLKNLPNIEDFFLNSFDSDAINLDPLADVRSLRSFYLQIIEDDNPPIVTISIDSVGSSDPNIGFTFAITNYHNFIMKGQRHVIYDTFHGTFLDLLISQGFKVFNSLLENTTIL